MKKLFRLIAALLMTMTLAACGTSNNYKPTFVAEGELGIQTYKTLTKTALAAKIENEASFILYISTDGCTSCKEFSKVLEEVIKTNDLVVYNITTKILGGTENDLIPFKTAPTIVIYDKGKVKSKINFLDDEETLMDKEKLTNHFKEYALMPTKININETQLDEKLNNQETFIVYFGWHLCSDCSALATNFLNDYLLTKTNGKKIYYFEINDYRCLPGAEACDSKNPTYLALKEKYEWNYVPTLIYYENGKKTDMAVYYNDTFAEGSLRDWKENGMTVTESYYNDLVNQTFTDKEKYIEFHNNKVNEFLNTYLPKTN